jgi:hypothetical protein
MFCIRYELNEQELALTRLDLTHPFFTLEDFQFAVGYISRDSQVELLKGK